MFCQQSQLTNHALILALPADADLTERKIKSKASGVVKHISMLVAIAIFTILLTFDHFPRAKNYEYSYDVHAVHGHSAALFVQVPRQEPRVQGPHRRHQDAAGSARDAQAGAARLPEEARRKQQTEFLLQHHQLPISRTSSALPSKSSPPLPSTASRT